MPIQGGNDGSLFSANVVVHTCVVARAANHFLAYRMGMFRFWVVALQSLIQAS
jgi:hypothetical protein